MIKTWTVGFLVSGVVFSVFVLFFVLGWGRSRVTIGHRSAGIRFSTCVFTSIPKMIQGPKKV